MKLTNYIRLLAIIGFVALCNIATSQQAVVFTPSKDAYLYMTLKPGYEYYANTNYGMINRFYSGEWSASNYRVNQRSLLDFDLTRIPAGAIILEAKLSLYSMQPQISDDYRHISYLIRQSTSYKTNASNLERITSSWTETGVTYNTQPTTTTNNRIVLPESEAYDQNYLNIDVTALVQDMVNSPAQSHGFMLQLANESKYSRMAFCSRDYVDPARWPKLIIKYSAAKLYSGYDHNLLIGTSGALWAWGNNLAGQLGDGTTTDKYVPVMIGEGNDWKQVAAGKEHTLAIKKDGTLWAWGGNNWGQLGDGTTMEKHAPVQIDTATNWQEISAGWGHSLAIKSDGTLWAWGRNSEGQLGAGTDTNIYSPVQIGKDLDWKTIEGGYYSSWAVRNDGTLWAWGDNEYGQLGDGTTSNKKIPFQIGTDWKWEKVSGGMHTMAIKKDGTLWGWGYNSGGQLGDGTTENKLNPVQIGNDANWKKIVTGSYHTLAVKTDGILWAWGVNELGQLGDGTKINNATPIQVKGIANCYQVDAGNTFSLLVKPDALYCGTGSNDFGQLGDGTTLNKQTYDCIEFTQAEIAIGERHGLFINTDGTLWAWGYGGQGAIGDGTNEFRSSPVHIGTDVNWMKISAGGDQSLAIKTDGSLWAWGDNLQGQLGDGTTTTRFSPVQIGTDLNWKEISTGGNIDQPDEGHHSLAIKSDGTLWAWGSNRFGQLGDGTTTDKHVPVQIDTAADWKEISAGVLYSLAIKTDGTLWGWGYNIDCQLGDGTSKSKLSPVQIGTDTNWKHISAGQYHSIGIKTDGTLWAWGFNYTDVPIYYSPVQLGTDKDWQEVSACATHSLAIKTNGTLWAWGNNFYGQLGTGVTNQYTAFPAQVPGVTSCIQAATGAGCSLVLKSDQRYCGSGNNEYGLLGDGSYVNKLTFNCYDYPVALKSTFGQTSPAEYDSKQINTPRSYLFQNYPNPAQDITTIDYFLYEDANDASIIIYNLLNAPVKQYPISNIGKSGIKADLQDLPSGIYFYVLLVNGERVDKKKMVLNK